RSRSRHPHGDRATRRLRRAIAAAAGALIGTTYMAIQLSSMTHAVPAPGARARAPWVLLAAMLAPAIAPAAAPERVDQLVRTTLHLDANAERGAKLYAEHCAQCHGEKALGNAANLIPSLAGQRRAYVIKQ